MISVIVPVYNVEAYLEQCLKSIAGQTYHYIEAILIDDGSTDNSGVICDQFAENDKRFRVIHQDNRGLSAARNTGIDISKGDSICFVDSDDWIQSQMLEHLIRIMNADNDIDVVCCANKRIERDEDEVKYNSVPECVVATGSSMLSDYIHDISGFWPMSCAKLYRTHLFAHQRFPIGKIHEDEYVTYKVLWNSRKVAYTNCEYYYYRQRSDSIMKTESFKSRADAIEALIKRNEWLLQQGFDKKECEWDRAASLHALHDLKESDERKNDYNAKRIRGLYELWYKKNKASLTLKERVGGIKYYFGSKQYD